MQINLVGYDFVQVFGLETGTWYGIIVLYLGPETMMPVASALAGIIGAVIMFWQRLVRWMKRLVRYFKSKTGTPKESKRSV